MSTEPAVPIRLTQFSKGGGCGCKISPKILEEILRSNLPSSAIANVPQLLIGNETKDDAAVYDIGNGMGIVSTTDFFTPIVDDPFQFGQIAATNALSDVYAMGGTPIMAIAILGWPLKKLPAAIARQVIDGARSVCSKAMISLSGGHSIDTEEPIFGLAATGTVQIANVKANSTALPGCRLYLTKPIGIGLLTTAEKKGKLRAEDVGRAADVMCSLNSVGRDLGQVQGVTSMTDVTGFGLVGHLLEMCEGSGVVGRLRLADIPFFPGLDHYMDCAPGGTERNFDSYRHKVIEIQTAGRHFNNMGGGELSQRTKTLLCDPQTSGGLLVAVEPDSESKVVEILKREGVLHHCIGTLEEKTDSSSPVFVVVESDGLSKDGEV